MFPVELFLQVFHVLPLSDRVRVGLVCSHWRQIVLTDPELWTRVRWTGRRPDTLQGILGRALGSPLNIHVIIHPNTPAWVNIDIIKAISAHLSHTRQLRIQMGVGWCRLKRTLLLNAMSYALVAPAPILEQFAFRFDDWEASDPVLLDEHLFGGHSPRLQRLVLNKGLFFNADCQALEHVTHLTLPSMPDTEVLMLGELFPQLHSLRLGFTAPVVLRGSFPLLLSRLTLDFQYPTFGFDTIDRIGEFFHFRSIQWLQLSQYCGLLTDSRQVDLFLHVLDRSPRLAIRASCCEERLSYKFSSSTGQVLIVDDVLPDVRLADDVFYAVTHITIQEVCFLSSLAFLPALPQAQTLELVLLSPGIRTKCLHAIDACLAAKSAIWCPALCAVKFSNHKRARERAAIDVDSILTFLRACVSFQDDSLIALVLNNVDLLSDDENLYEELCQLVGEVYVTM